MAEGSSHDSQRTVDDKPLAPCRIETGSCGPYGECLRCGAWDGERERGCTAITFNNQCCAELKLMAGVRCSRIASAKRDGKWFCFWHDTGPREPKKLSLMDRFAHIEVTNDE